MSAPSNVAYVKESNKISNETRSIRTVAVVHENECVGCGVCAEVCPEGAIAVDDLAVIDIQKCTACGACMYECPQNAISLTELKEVAS
ncbi:MAG: 4Fe-4S binding protein [candidate division Zixibacteria bacterium]|nr:4Fe-4S binding protein [candidate division Zixibacteria bacterium]